MPDIKDQLAQHIPRLRRYARSLTRNADSAEDLVQSTLLLAIKKQHLYKEDVDLRAWLFTILHNLHVNLVRKKKRMGEVVCIETLDLPVKEAATGALLLRDLERALKKLPTDMINVIMLITLEGMTYEEASQVLNTPLGTVRSRLSRGRERLRDIMKLGPTTGSARLFK